jgi:epsin
LRICILSDASPPVNPSPAVNSFEMDLFGSDPIGELALVSVPQPTAIPNVEPPANSGFETNSFMGMPPASSGFSEVWICKVYFQLHKVMIIVWGL